MSSQNLMEKYLNEWHGRGLGNEDKEKEHGAWVEAACWVLIWPLSLRAFIFLFPVSQIRRFNARFFLEADVTIQRIIRQTTSEPCVVVGSSKLWKWISIHGKRFITSVALSFPAISVWNGKETSKRKWRPDLAMFDKSLGGGYTSLKYPLW